MKKYIVSSVVVGAIVLYILYQHMQGPATVALAPTTPAASSSSQNTTNTSSTASGNTNNTTASNTSAPAAAVPTSRYKNGTYTGPTTNAFYGPMQVAAVISGGKLTAINVLQYPQTHSYSIMVNNEALPYLKSEAIQAQSATIDSISGATASSDAFMQSLAAALSQASNG